MRGQETAEERRPQLNAGERWALASLCLVAGVAALAARWIPGDVARVAYGVVLAAVLLALTLWARSQPSLGRFWELAFAFFVFALVQVLNNSLPRLAGTYVLHETPGSGDPLGTTVLGSVVIQLLDTLIAVVPVLVLTAASGRDLGSVYARRGSLGRGLVIAVLAFVAFFLLTATLPLHRLFPTHGTVTPARLLAFTPALLVLVISNGFQEEFLFRGLFLQKYYAFFGVHTANFLQAAIFCVAHAGVTYTPIAVLFLVVFVLPLGLFTGYLMRTSNGVIAPAIFHAGADIPIYVAFLSFVA